MLFFVTALGSAAPPFEQAEQEGSLYTDADLGAIIEHDLGALQINNKAVEVLGGIVTLRGEVASVGDKNEASAIASKFPQVKQVVNEMSVVWDGSDTEIAQEVVRRLNGYVHYSIYDGVQTEVRNGVLRLTGEVTRAPKVHEIGTFLSKVPGVRSVDNEIRALPFVLSDENLRVSVAVALYRALPEYAVQPAVPIHVVVENGRVTLEGIVRTEEERLTAERTIRRVQGVTDVDNRLELQNPRASSPTSGS